MALNVSLTSLVNQVQILADNHRLTTAQITGFINQGYTMLWDKLTEAYGADYNLKQCQFNTVVSTTNYPLSYNITFTNATAPFTVGLTMTGGTSAATGVIRSVNFNGSVTTNGTLSLSDLSFNGAGSTGFTVNETITDSGGGSAKYTSNNSGCGAADFYKLRGLDVQYQGTQYLPLKPYIWKDRNAYTNAYAAFGQFPGTYLRYHLQGDSINFTPTPNSANLIRLSYTPAPAPLINQTDVLNGVAGWEQYIINFAAIQCLINEETDASQIMRQQAEIEARITKMSTNRDSGEATQVAAASETDNDWGPFGFGGW